MSLSTKQASIIDQIKTSEDGKFIIKACPGSGKTHTISNLLVKELSDWKSSTKGIAVLSFTNKAREEIEEKITKHIGAKPRFRNPHFVGTFDTFFNQNVFLPFAKESLNLPRKPELVGDPFSNWGGLNIKWSKHLFEHLDYAIDGNFAPLNLMQVGLPRSTYDTYEAVIHEMKKTVNRRGFFTQKDAVYFTNRILQDNNDIAKLLANRYPYVIIDEAQDSSDISMAIVDLLISSGVKKVVIIGDPDQAIYEWNNAKPSLFWEKWNSDNWTKLELDESFRSSDCICNFVSAFGRGASFEAAEKCLSKHTGIKPYLEVVNLSNFKEDPDTTRIAIDVVKEKFLQLCEENAIPVNSSSVAILCRGKDDVPIIKGGVARATFVDWKDCTLKNTAEICKAKFCYDMGEYPKAYRHWINAKTIEFLDKATVIQEDAKKYEHDSGGIRLLMKTCILELASYSSILNLKLADWIGSNLPLETNHTKIADCMAGEVFQKLVTSTQVNEPLFSTIHGVKGASFDAVLLFLKKKGSSGIQYNTYINDTNKSLQTDNTEEIRIAYVAISRPRQLLMLAVPEDHYDVWNNGFTGLFS